MKGNHTLFRGCKSLYCVVNLLRNLYSGKMIITPFWEAVEATSKEEFDEVFRKFLQTRKMEELKSCGTLVMLCNS